jgi:hypothetical protein
MSTSLLRRATPVGLLISVILLVATFAPSASAGAASPCKVHNRDSDAVSTDLQVAINDANAGDMLRVKGTCVGNFLIGKDLKLRGAGGDAGILDGNDAGRTVFVASGVTATLRRLTITGGLTPSSSGGNGAGIRNDGTLTIRNSRISGNDGQGFAEGGGIENNSTLTVNSSTITGNTADKAGGIHGEVGSTTTLNDSTITGNTVTDTGGGIDFVASTVTLNDSTITGNTAGTCGGGVFTSGGTLNVLGTSSISGNTPDNVVSGSCP